MIRLGLGLVVWAALSTPSAAAPCPGTRHAVVIGIDQYAHGVQPLRGARGDAERVAKALKAQGFQVTTVLDEAATRDRLRGLQWHWQELDVKQDVDEAEDLDRFPYLTGKQTDPMAGC